MRLPLSLSGRLFWKTHFLFTVNPNITHATLSLQSLRATVSLPGVIAQVPDQEVVQVRILGPELISGCRGVGIGGVGVEVALNALREVLLEIRHGVVAGSPGPRGPGRVVEGLQFAVEAWKDEGEPQQVRGVGELVDGDVLGAVPVVAVAEGVLLGRGTNGQGHGRAQASGPLVPGGPQPGVLGDVCGELGGVGGHDGVAEPSGRHRARHPGVHVRHDGVDEVGGPLEGRVGGLSPRDDPQAVLRCAEAAVVVGVRQGARVGLDTVLALEVV